MHVHMHKQTDKQSDNKQRQKQQLLDSAINQNRSKCSHRIQGSIRIDGSIPMGCARLPSARGSDVEDVEGPTSLLCKRTRWSPCTALGIWGGEGSSADACATDDAAGAHLTGSSLLSQMKPWRPKAFTSSGSWQMSQHVDVAKFWWWKVSNPWMLRHRWQWMRRTGSPTDSASRQQPANCIKCGP